MSVLVADDVHKNFGETTAVGGVSLEVAAGECVAILGANGAGKTTFVEMLEGLQEPSKGTISIFGSNFGAQRREIQQQIGVLLQETNMYKRMTVKETLEYFASFFEKTREVGELAEKFQLSEKLNSQLRTLSGGQKQRVYLAAAMINNPKILFLDEPTTGLDPAARRFVWQLVREHKQAGNAVVLTTHYMEEAELLADRVFLMSEGRMIVSDSPHNLVSKNVGKAVINLSLEAGEGCERAVNDLSKDMELGPIKNIGNEIELFCETEESAWSQLTKIRSYFDDAKIKLIGASVRRANLEDVFLKLTGKGLLDDK